LKIEDIIQDVNKVFIEVLEDEDIVLTNETTANDIDEWDSLNHIQLIIAIEKKFQIRFTSADIQRWKDVQEMCDSIQNYLAKK
jgi:acyl carrier protein